MRKKVITKRCARCDKVFETKIPKVKFCSIKCGKLTKFGKEDIKSMTSLYLSGTSINSLAKIYNHAPETCKRALIDSGVEMRSFRRANILNGKNIRKYKLNESYFHTIDTEDKAYWLGFIATDGNINKVSNTLYISLQERDRMHLLKLLKCLGSNYNVVDHTNTNGSKQSRVAITSYDMKCDLVRHGIMPNKSLTITPPIFYDVSLEKAFWRGCVDGDGTIFRRNKNDNRKEWAISLLGTYAMVDAFSQFVTKGTGLRPRNIMQDSKIYRVSYQGSFGPITVIKYLYGSAKIFLDRKMNLANEAMTDIARYGSKYKELAIKEIGGQTC
jgi:hypothetical protein